MFVLIARKHLYENYTTNLKKIKKNYCTKLLKFGKWLVLNKNKCYYIQVMNNILNKILIVLLMFTAISAKSYANTYTPQTLSDCNAQYGYTQIKEIIKVRSKYLACHNPNRNLSYYSVDGKSYVFFLNDRMCGANCDMNGNNCKSGFCNRSGCDKEHGYELAAFQYDKTTRCYNKSIKLSYRLGENGKTFYYNDSDVSCGVGCDFNGKNCSYEPKGTKPKIGICNPDDCPKGYIVDSGYCKNPKTGKSLYKNINGKPMCEDAKEKV